jgi:hypothetical protein
MHLVLAEPAFDLSLHRALEDDSLALTLSMVVPEYKLACLQLADPTSAQVLLFCAFHLFLSVPTSNATYVLPASVPKHPAEKVAWHAASVADNLPFVLFPTASA